MNSTNNTILAIAPATKRFGAIVFRNKELIYFAVKTLKPSRTDESIKPEVSRSIKNLLKEFVPKVVIIKSPGKQQIKSINFKLTAESIESEAEFNKIPVIRIKFETVKKYLCADSKSTKDNTFKSLANVYPELRQFINNSNKWRTEYYDSLMIATALGYYYQTELTETGKQTRKLIIHQ